jgi:hypothetical protein
MHSYIADIDGLGTIICIHPKSRFFSTITAVADTWELSSFPLGRKMFPKR